jgi:beta-lactamase class A
VRRLDDGHEVEAHADAVVPLASVGKVLLLAEVARRLDDGSLAADHQVALTAEDRALGGTGLLARLSPTTWTAHDLVTATAAVSDNAATNALLRLVGLDAVQRLATAAGLRHTTVHDRIRVTRGAGDPPQFATGTPRELVDLLTAVADDRLVSAGTSRRLRGWMRLNTDRALVADAVRHDPYGPGQVTVMNKTGTDDGVRADVGIVDGRRRVVYAVVSTFPAGEEMRAVAEVRRWGATVNALAACLEPDQSSP